jgi:hypothetical protein
MDFRRVLQSLEEFLYEAMSWLVFYPRSLWRTLRHPVSMALYTQEQLALERDQQFKEVVGPPLMLILTVVVAHVIELTYSAPAPSVTSAIGKELFSSEQATIATRSIAYCLFALFGALGLLWRQQVPIDRESLRAPFYLHCYLLAPFALGLAIAVAMGDASGDGWHVSGAALGGISCLWYVVAQTRVYCELLQTTAVRAGALAVGANLVATVVILVLGLLVLGVDSPKTPR